ncbi:unnamed protein product, partial [Polarella glacialis]
VPVLLDFGNCIKFSEPTRLAWCQLLVALPQASVTGVREALGVIGVVTSQTEMHPERDMEWMMAFFRDTGNRKQQLQGIQSLQNLRKSQQNSDVEALPDSMKGDKKMVKANTKRYPTELPDNIVLFFRMILLVRGLCSSLDVQLPFMQIFTWHAHRAQISRFPRATRLLSLTPPSDGRSKSIAVDCNQVLSQQIRAELERLSLERPGFGAQ